MVKVLEEAQSDWGHWRGPGARAPTSSLLSGVLGRGYWIEDMRTSETGSRGLSLTLTTEHISDATVTSSVGGWRMPFHQQIFAYILMSSSNAFSLAVINLLYYYISINEVTYFLWRCGFQNRLTHVKYRSRHISKKIGSSCWQGQTPQWVSRH